MSAPDSLISEVAAGLFVGSLSSLSSLRNSQGRAQSLGITHVVSVVNFAVRTPDGVMGHLQLPLRDSKDADLLTHLPRACAFMHAALAGQPLPSGGREPAAEQGAAPSGSLSSGGKVLVHCQAGVSRSVAVAAAYIMRSQAMDAAQAVARIRAAHPVAAPNEGFVAQLQLFGDMRCSLDLNHPVYRMWCLEQVGVHREEEGWVDPDAFSVLPDMQQASKEGCTLYRCRKCRALVATSRQVLPVEAAEGHRVFRSGPCGTAKRHEEDWRQQQPGQGPEGCRGGASLFVVPIAWMADAVVGAVRGKLYCPSAACNTRLGSFNWSGISNERGQWVTPAFQLHLAKLDTLLPARPLLVRAPLAGPPAAPPAALQQHCSSSGSSSGGGSSSSSRRSGSRMLLQANQL